MILNIVLFDMPHQEVWHNDAWLMNVHKDNKDTILTIHAIKPCFINVWTALSTMKARVYKEFKPLMCHSTKPEQTPVFNNLLPLVLILLLGNELTCLLILSCKSDMICSLSLSWDFSSSICFWRDSTCCFNSRSRVWSGSKTQIMW